MGARYVVLLLFFAVTITRVTANSSGGVPWHNLVSGWPPLISLDDPNVQSMAEFAVAEHNKGSGDRLSYVKVVSGGSQPHMGQGRYYRLILMAEDSNGGGGSQGSFEAIVWNYPAEGVRKLISFSSYFD